MEVVTALVLLCMLLKKCLALLYARRHMFSTLLSPPIARTLARCVCVCVCVCPRFLTDARRTVTCVCWVMAVA